MIARTPPDVLHERIEVVRRFDGFYERRLRSAYRVAEVNELTPAELRVFRALGAAGEGACAAWLNARLRMDPSYLSRILQKFQVHGFVAVRVSELDRRHRDFALTDWGRRVQNSLDDDQRERVRVLLKGLPQRQQRRLVHAMKVVEEILTRDPLEHFLEDWFARRPRERI
jgi:DNA-binding MarR family transcriptional regulator